MKATAPMKRFRTCRSARILGATVLLAVAVGTSPVAAQKEDKAANGKETFEGEQQWKSLFYEAKKAYNEKRYKEAKALLIKASAIKPTPQVIANLAQAEMELGEFVAAATHASQALVGLGKNPVLQAELAKAKEHIGTVALFFNVEGVEVSVDGAPIGTSPITTPVYLEPGTHKIVARKVGYASQERTLAMDKGTEQRVDIQLMAEESATKTAPNQAKSPDESGKTKLAPFEEPKHTNGSGPNPYILVGGGVVTVGALVAGLVFNSKANGKYDDGERLVASIDAGDCFTPSSTNKSACAAAIANGEEGDKAKNIATASFIVGGAAAVGTLVYWLWPRRSAPTTDKSVQFNAMAVPGNAWLGLSSRF